MPIAATFVAVCWIAFVVVWLITALSVKPTKERQPWAGRLVYLVILIAVVVLLNGGVRQAQLNRRIVPPTLRIAILADVLVFAGFVIAVWARMVLGGNWSARVVLKEGHELIQRGPYRLVRHPIYSGVLLMILGTAVIAGTLSGFVALVACFAGFWLKLRQEENLLRRRLPGYSEYMARTRALIPFLL